MILSRRWIGIATAPLFARSGQGGSQWPSPTSPLRADDVRTINIRMRDLQGPRLRSPALTLLPQYRRQLTKAHGYRKRPSRMQTAQVWRKRPRRAANQEQYRTAIRYIAAHTVQEEKTGTVCKCVAGPVMQPSFHAEYSPILPIFCIARAIFKCD
jgi:hypothetical protein